MNSKLLYNQIKDQLPPMEGVAVKVEDNKMNFYIDGRLEFYVRETGGVTKIYVFLQILFTKPQKCDIIDI